MSIKLHSCMASIMAFSAMTASADQAQDGADTAELTRRIERLERQNDVLRASYTEARREAEEAKDQLVKIRMRMDALGGAALGNSEERLVRAVAELEQKNRRIQELEQVTAKMSGSVIAYMKQSISEDALTRAAVESSLRELDAVLGFRQQPVKDGAGNLAEALVVSIDSESGMLVLNIGREAGARVGMPLKVTRGTQLIGEAVVTDVRKAVCGALIQKLTTPDDAVRVGDSASVKTIN